MLKINEILLCIIPIIILLIYIYEKDYIEKEPILLLKSYKYIITKIDNIKKNDNK